jgi:hypothetical protein
VAPEGWKTGEGRWVVGFRAHNRGESFVVARQRGWLVVRYGLCGAGEGGGGDIFVWLCRINLDMVGLRYIRNKCGRLRCGGLHTI